MRLQSNAEIDGRQITELIEMIDNDSHPRLKKMITNKPYYHGQSLMYLLKDGENIEDKKRELEASGQYEYVVFFLVTTSI